MRILIVHEALTGGGGVESYLATLMPALQARGHQLAFLHHNSRNDEGGISLERPGIPTAGVLDEGLDAVILRMRAWHPDVCFAHNMRYLEVEERLMAEWPVVKMMHGYFGTCLGGHKAKTFPAVELCTRRCGVGCLALYLPRRCGQLRPLVMLEQFRWASRQRGLFPRYAGIVVTSDHMRDEYERYDIGPAHLTTAPLFPTAGASRGLRPLPETPTVLFVGRMVDLKGGEVLLRAAAAANLRLPVPVHLVFAGDGPERQHWTTLASQLGVAATFTGWVSGDDREAAFRSASVLAVPSLFPEPFGLVGVEAAAHGVPAVAFDVGGIAQWLHDDINGRLVSERNAESLGAALAALLGSPADLRRLGAGALQTAAALSVDAHVDVLEDVLSRARTRPAAIA